MTNEETSAVELFRMSAKIWRGAAQEEKPPTFSRGDCREWADRFDLSADLAAEVLRLREQATKDAKLSDWQMEGIIEIMIRNPNVDSFVREKENRIAMLEKTLKDVSIEIIDYLNDDTGTYPLETALETINTTLGNK
jgi:hypothetical protein